MVRGRQAWAEGLSGHPRPTGLRHLKHGSKYRVLRKGGGTVRIHFPSFPHLFFHAPVVCFSEGEHCMIGQEFGHALCFTSSINSPFPVFGSFIVLLGCFRF